MRVIFLDIDGVLNQLQSYHIDDACLLNLKLIVNKLNAKIVLVSSWRKGYVKQLDKCTPQVQKLIAKLTEHKLELYSKTQDYFDRTKEIQTWIQNKEDSGETIDYIVIDDDKLEYSNTKILNHYWVNCKTGLTTSDAKKIIKRFK